MRKKIFIGIVFVLVAAVMGFLAWQKGYFGPRPGAWADVETNLTREQKQVYTDKIAKAEEYLKTLNSTQPGFATEASNVYVFLSQQYDGLGKIQQAREMCETALKYYPNNSDAMVQLADLWAKAGDMTQAKHWLEEDLKLNPTNQNIWLRFIQINQNLGLQNGELANIYGQALLSTGSHIDVLTSAAKFEEQIGNISQAIEFWQQAKEKYPQNSTIYQQEIERLKPLQKK